MIYSIRLKVEKVSFVVLSENIKNNFREASTLTSSFITPMGKTFKKSRIFTLKDSYFINN